MGKFKKGDICFLINCVYYPELNGTEVTLTSDAIEQIGIQSGKEFIGYVSDLFYHGMPISLMEHQLVLKKFDGEDKIIRMFDIDLTEKTNTVKILEETI